MDEALDLIPLRVLNLTADDLHFWPTLSTLKHPHTKVISSNLEAGSGQTQPDRTAIVEVDIRGLKARIGFLGLCDPSLVKPNSGFRATPLETATANALLELGAKADFVVLLADIPRPIAEALAAKHPEIYAIILVERQYRLLPPAQFGNAVLLSTVERGRYLGQLVIGLDAAKKVAHYAPDYIQLSQDIPEEPVLLERSTSVSRLVGGGVH